jgi:glycogen operon protein
MILMGDELSRSQSGNNNAYCQDNPLSWLDWEGGLAADPDLPAFIGAALSIRRRFDAFRRTSFLNGDNGNGLKDVYWLSPEGREITPDDWADGERRCLGAQFGNDAADGHRFLLVMNAARKATPFKLSADLPGEAWTEIFSSAIAGGAVNTGSSILPGGTVELPAHSLVLFQERPSAGARQR